TVISINSGTFSAGQNYPLLAWTNGSAPAVVLGTVSGATGALSTNGNQIQFNVASVTRPTLNLVNMGNSLQFSWDGSLGTYKLQSQTNNLDVGLGTNWIDFVSGSTNPVTV